MGKAKLYIARGSTVYECAVESGVVWETARTGTPGKLTFNVVKDNNIDFREGDPVRFEYDGKKVFFGYVFVKKRTNHRMISVTCYDQLRYFKNKDTYSYKNKTAAQVLKMLANDFKLKWGHVDDTKFVIKSRVEDNQELFTIIDNAITITTVNTGQNYILYDDFGNINLRALNKMRLDLLIDEASGESFEYTTSIDDNTYTKIKLTREDKKKKKREHFIVSDLSNGWGILQYTDTLEEGENGKAKAENLLKMYNKKSRKLHINKVFGDVRVRGGSIVGVQMYLGDMVVANYMMVESVKHTFNSDDHRMDLQLVGGEFSA